MGTFKGRFYKTFANLPLGTRDEIVLVVGGQPMTWNVIKLEIDVGSRISKKALKLLNELKLIREK